MLVDVVSVTVLDGYQVQLRFKDGVEGIADIGKMVKFTGIFAPLVDHDYFAKVSVNPVLGTIAWPNGADIDPDVLYASISGKTIPNYQSGIPAGKH